MSLPRLRKIPPWCRVGPGGQQVFCERCGKIKTMELPLPVDAFILELHAFGVAHETCVAETCARCDRQPEPGTTLCAEHRDNCPKCGGWKGAHEVSCSLRPQNEDRTG